MKCALIFLLIFSVFLEFHCFAEFWKWQDYTVYTMSDYFFFFVSATLTPNTIIVNKSFRIINRSYDHVGIHIFLKSNSSQVLANILLYLNHTFLYMSMRWQHSCHFLDSCYVASIFSTHYYYLKPKIFYHCLFLQYTSYFETGIIGGKYVLMYTCDTS